VVVVVVMEAVIAVDTAVVPVAVTVVRITAGPIVTAVAMD
jgi:hypothetical protein